jgi:predicted Fe-Mo cluster-binding NifX family protein
MKIAIPIDNNKFIDDHFGHCHAYLVYDIDNERNIYQYIIESPHGCGCKSNIASILKEDGVTVMLAGNMGEGAHNMLQAYGINVIRGCRGPADQALRAYLKGDLEDQDILCAQHRHHHGHACQN